MTDTFLATQNTNRGSYSEVARSSLIGVYSRGLHGSLAFKLSEYLAAGLCIVAEPLRHTLPQPLEARRNYLPFNTPEECVAQCKRLLDDPELAAAMSRNNRDYYSRFVEPTVHLRNILHCAFNCH